MEFFSWKQSVKKRILKFGSMGLSVVMIAILLVVFTPGSVSISLGGFLPGKVEVNGFSFGNIKQSGFLSFNSNVALAVGNPSENGTATQPYSPGDEMVEKRTRNSKTHYLGGASYAWDGTIGSIHYEEKDEWLEIDNVFEPANAPWDWQMLKAGYHIRVKEDFTAGQIIEFEKQGETVQFQPMALEWTNDNGMIQPIAMPHKVTPTITNPEVDLLPAVGMPSHQGTIRWNNAYGEALDFEWVCSSTRLIKHLIVNQPESLPKPEKYILDGGNPVLRLNLIFDLSRNIDCFVNTRESVEEPSRVEKWDSKTKKQTFDAIEFRKDGEALWGFMPLRYWDSKEGEENDGQSIATLEKQGDKLYISIRVPYDWLQGAIYPVFIDTDVDEQVGASRDDGFRWNNTIYPTNTAHSVGQHSGGSIGDAWMRFDGITMAQGSTIDVAYISLREYGSAGTPLTKIYAEDANDPDAPTSDAEFDTDIANKTTAGVDWDGDPGADGYHNSPSIISVISELTTSYTYSNQAILILHLDDGSAAGEVNTSLSWDFSDHSLAPKLHIEYTEGAPPEPDISNSPDSKAFGIVELGTSVWSNSSAPTFPLDDSECYFTITNNGDACSITIQATNFTGEGTNWTLGTPAANVARLKAGKSGDSSEGDMVTLTNSPQAFITGLATSTTKKWEIKLEMPTSADKYQKTSTITLIASLD